VGVGIDAGDDAEQHRHARSSQPGNALDVVEPVDDDPADARIERRLDVRVTLRIAVHEN
jgi:hypothetical protein